MNCTSPAGTRTRLFQNFPKKGGEYIMDPFSPWRARRRFCSRSPYIYCLYSFSHLTLIRHVPHPWYALSLCTERTLRIGLLLDPSAAVFALQTRKPPQLQTCPLSCQCQISFVRQAIQFLLLPTFSFSAPEQPQAVSRTNARGGNIPNLPHRRRQWQAII